MGTDHDRVKAARGLLRAIEQGDTRSLLASYAENEVQVEHPNRLKPKGDRRGPAKMAEDLARGKQLLAEEHCEVIEAVATGDNVAMQLNWTGVLAVPVGTLKAGETMTCESAVFLRFQGDRIVEQHNHDCFPPF